MYPRLQYVLLHDSHSALVVQVILEGTIDGREWKEYEFKYKAGSVERRPPVVAPHQPRLDWQMWFAALGTWERQVQSISVLSVPICERSSRLLSGFCRIKIPV
jgi:lipase maturation factor